MEEFETTKIVMPTWLNQTLQQQTGRIQTLVDILYLMSVTWCYIMSFIYPLLGIIIGVILSQGSISASGKKIGRICLILGVINIVLVILFIIIFVIFGGILSRFNPYSL